MTEINLTDLAKLREPFAKHLIGQKPKGGTMLSYLGHAALTDRLLDVDPMWSWEPLALDERGLPAFDANGGLWIKLTICGVTRLGYGDPDGKKGPNAIKEAIGDALRNSGMRFGAALDLWHKGDLHEAEPVPPPEYIGALGRVVELAKAKEISGEQGQKHFEAVGGVGKVKDCTDVAVLEKLFDRLKGA